MLIKRLTAAFLSVCLLAGACLAGDLVMESDAGEASEEVFAETEIPGAPDISAPSAILIEKATGAVLYEKNADQRLEPASVTKIMTILLIVEALEDGRLGIDEPVTVSARAASMGGSQIFLSEGETMSVRDMLKAIVVASANDAAVAMAERLCGTEEAFAAAMNARAEKLGMTNTVFLNATGLLDQPEHLTTARDVSLMARELISHDMIKEYTTIWTDTLRDGGFGLSNTNKLIRFYPGATGLKTGFTSRAGYCLAATAERDGVEYIAVVMNCKTSNDRFESAKALLSWAFSNYTLFEVSAGEALPPVKVSLGEAEYVQPVLADASPLLINRSAAGEISRKTEVVSGVSAPVKAGQVLGRLTVSLGQETLAEVPVIAPEAVPKLSRLSVFGRVLAVVFFGRGF